MSARNERIAARRRQGRRRWSVTAGALGLLGIGLGAGAAVATTAAWTDQVWATGTVETGSADLQGSVNLFDWVDSSDAGQIELVFTAMSDLRPGGSYIAPIHLRNTGTLDAALSGDVETSGALFAGASPATAVLSSVPATLAAGEATSALLTVTAPDWTGQDYMGSSGTVIVSVTGAVP